MKLRKGPGEFKYIEFWSVSGAVFDRLPLFCSLGVIEAEEDSPAIVIGSQRCASESEMFAASYLYFLRLFIIAVQWPSAVRENLVVVQPSYYYPAACLLSHGMLLGS